MKENLKVNDSEFNTANENFNSNPENAERENIAVDSKHKKVQKFSVPVLIIALITIIALLIGWGKTKDELNDLKVKEAEKKGLIINEYFVADELKAIGELSTGEYTYTIEKTATDYRRIFDCNIPLTGKSFDIFYSGEVEVSYNIADMKPIITEKIIVFNIPKPIVENYITKEVVKDEKNNIFNPINSDDYAKLRDGVLEEGLEKAVDKGIYDTAEDELKTILKEHFKKFGCTVIFY